MLPYHQDSSVFHVFVVTRLLSYGCLQVTLLRKGRSGGGSRLQGAHSEGAGPSPLDSGVGGGVDS